MAALGDIIYRAAALWTRLAGNITTTNKFLRQVGTGAVSAAPSWSDVTDVDLVTSDVTTNNASTTKHGFLKKLDNSATSFMNGQGNWSTPSGAGDVAGPGSAVADDFVQFNGTTGKIIKDGGLSLTTSVGSPGSDLKVPTEKAVRTAITGVTKPFVCLKTLAGVTGVTININSTTYTTTPMFPLEWVIDMDTFSFTSYRIIVSGSSNASGQSITLQACVAGAPGTPLHTGGNDLQVDFTSALYDSSWKTRDTSNTGTVTFSLAAKGSNATVDFTPVYVEIMMRID